MKRIFALFFAASFAASCLAQSVGIPGGGRAVRAPSTAPSNGQVLIWNSTTKKWDPASPSANGFNPSGTGFGHATSGTWDSAAKAVDLSGADATGTMAAARMPALTGDVTTSAGAVATTIANGAVSNAKMANMANHTAKGRDTAGTGAPEDVTISAMLDWVGATRGSILYRGATGWAVLAPGTSGYALVSNGAGADPTWQAQSGSGGGGGSAPAGTMVSSGTWAAGDLAKAADGTGTNFVHVTAQQVNDSAHVLTALGDAATITGLDLSLSDQFIVELGGNRTLPVPSNIPTGRKVFTVTYVQNGTRTISHTATNFIYGADINNVTLSTTLPTLPGGGTAGKVGDNVRYEANSTNSIVRIIGIVRGYAY